MRRVIIFIEASTTGAGQLALIAARKAGFHSVLFSRCVNQYNQSILSAANDVVACETNNVAAICKAIEQRNNKWKTTAVTTTADMYVPQAAFVADRLGLFGLRTRGALAARNKYLMRCILAKRAPHYSVPFFLVHNLNQALEAAQDLGYPLIVKPQKENDGVSVRLVHDAEQLQDYFQENLNIQYNSAGQKIPHGLLMEAYAHGREYSVETIHFPGRDCQIIGVTNKEMIGLERNCFIESGHSFPIKGNEADMVASATLQVLAVLGLEHGAAHTECRVNGDKVKVMEVNPRLAGGKIGSHLIKMATGSSAVDAVVDAALGREKTWRVLQEKGAAISFLWADMPGIFQGISNLTSLQAMPGIRSVSLLVEPGKKVQLPLSNSDSIAEILADGPNAAQALNNAMAAARMACLLIDPV
jgi:biotin carboxylase